MRMFKNSLTVSMSALLAMGALACGDDTTDPTPAPTPTPDAGPVGTGMDAGACPAAGRTCNTATGQIGFQSCANGVYGACTAIPIPDGGIGNLFDAAALFDGGIPQIEAGTIKCKDPLMCSDAFKGIVGNLSLCVENGQTLPPSCTTAGGACMVGSASGSCQNFLITNVCVIPCN